MKLKKRLNGYMTVEASLIMPMVLYICILIICLGFFLYDRCILEQDCYRIALHGSSHYKDDNQTAYNAAYSYMGKVVSDKYITKDYQFHVQVQKAVEVELSGRYILPPVQILRWISGIDGVIHHEVQSQCLNPVIILRLCHEFTKKEGKEEKQNDTDRIYQ